MYEYSEKSIVLTHLARPTWSSLPAASAAASPEDDATSPRRSSPRKQHPVNEDLQRFLITFTPTLIGQYTVKVVCSKIPVLDGRDISEPTPIEVAPLSSPIFVEELVKPPGRFLSFSSLIC